MGTGLAIHRVNAKTIEIRMAPAVQPADRRPAFNVVNGDVFRWSWMCAHLPVTSASIRHPFGRRRWKHPGNKRLRNT